MRYAAWAAIVLVVLLARLCHLDVLWVEEAYGMAAAAEVLRGDVLYRDVWFDKPPLYAWVYTLIGAAPGWPLRLLGTTYVLACCAVAWRFARDLWSEREGIAAAALMAFFLTFGIPSAVMALAPDVLLLLPSMVAVWLAFRRRPFAAGLVAGVGLLVNTKALFVLAACGLYGSIPRLAGGFAVPALGTFALLPREWLYQVWSWGSAYSRDTFVANPAVEGLRRTGNWLGFHATLVLGALAVRDWRLWTWAGLMLASTALGLRFFPRYYFALLPPLVLLAARGLCLIRRRYAVAALGLLLIPGLRFGPRYASLALGDRTWSDLAMNNDSRAAGTWIREHAQPGDDLLVWGYRPDIYVYSGLPAGTRFLDSQPLSGVLADRHLSDSRPTMPVEPAPARLPRFVADGLGLYNPALAAPRQLDLSGYSVVHRTAGTTIYRRP